MATVDLNHVQFWAPPSNPFIYKQHTASSQTKGSSICTNSSRNQPAPLHNKADRIFKRNDQSAITAARHQGDGFVAGAQGRNNDSTDRDDEADDDLPSIQEILGLISHQGISTGGDRNAEAALQDLDKPALDTSGNYIGPKHSRSDNSTGDSQGTQDRPVVIDGDELDSTDDEDEDEAQATCDSIDPSSAEQDEEPLLGLEPEDQEGSAASTPAHDHRHSLRRSPGPPCRHIGQHDNDRNTQSTLEEPATYSLPKLLDTDSRGHSGENVSDLERDMLLAFEEQEKSSSATALSSLQPPCRYTEQSSPQIDQEDDQGDTSHGRLGELGYGSPLREQDHSEGESQEQQPQQQQEVAVQAVREEEDDGDDNDDDGEQRGEKRRHQDGIERIRADVRHSENSSHSHDTSNEDEDPRPAKRRKFRLRHPLSLTPSEDSDSSEKPRPAKRRQPSPSNSNPTSKRTCKHHLQPSHKRHTAPVQTQPEQSPSILPGDHLQLKMAPNPTSAGDDESASNVSAEYQEWPMRGVFKRVIVGDEVRYGMEFSLEETHGLTCKQHTVAHDSTDGGDSQPGDLWDIRRITGMRKVDGVEEFRVAWAQTWMPESDLGGARELVEEFKARLSVRHGKKNGQAEIEVAGESPPKRRRGRPRRQL